MKTPSKILLLSLGLLTFASLGKGLTGDFSSKHLLPPAPMNSSWDLSAKPPLGALSQKYYYLGKGKQAHVFVSEDKEHVLKVFKPFFPEGAISLLGKKWKIRVSKLPFAKDVVSFFAKEQIEQQKEKDFQSYLNAFTLLKEETGLTFLHLAKTNHLQIKLEVHDKAGIKRVLDLDSTCFLLQRKTEMFYPSLWNHIANGENSQAKELLHSYVSLAKRVLKQGVINPTTVQQNFGCIGLQAIQIDVGRILTQNDINTPISSFKTAVQPLQKWIEEKAPHLKEYLEEVIADYNEVQNENLPQNPS